ncbi:MAG: CapA family protein [Anaerolineae bacterium]|nr:CapA family protein [Anaerolineae bacterium]
MMRKYAILFFALILLTACQTAVSTTPPPPTLTPTTEPIVIETAVPSETAVPPTQTAAPTATLPPTPTETPTPFTVGFDGVVPMEMKTAVTTLMQAHPDQFALTDGDADVLLTLGQNGAIGEWVFAVAAPFPTFADDISLADVQAAWQHGELVLTAEMATILRGWWGDPAQEPTIVAPDALIDTLWQTQTSYDDPVLTIVPFEQLDPRLKVLAVDGNSPISVFYDPDSYSLKLHFGLMGEETAVTQLAALWPESMTNRHDDQLTHITMTGPSGLSRAVADRMEKYGYQYPGEEIAPIMQAADIAHMSHENAFAPDCPDPTPTGGTTFCAQPKTIDLMTWLGVDVVELTGNHLNDWGRHNFLYTLDLYDEVGIAGYGGGRNLAEAQQPLLIENNGNKIAFVGCNPVGPWGVWAQADEPGALPCDDYSFSLAQIQELAAQGYVVVGSIQFLEQFQYAPFQSQRDAFLGFAEAGASIVHGAHGHHPMGFAFSGDHFVHYGTGNTFADQMFSLGTRQMFVDTYVVYNGRLLSTDLWTGMIEDYARPRKMTEEERVQLLQSVFDGSDFALGE